MTMIATAFTVTEFDIMKSAEAFDDALLKYEHAIDAVIDIDATPAGHHRPSHACHACLTHRLAGLVLVLNRGTSRVFPRLRSHLHWWSSRLRIGGQVQARWLDRDVRLAA
ncbi:hypothetical protein [Streptomyces anulatus]|uniref:hypothetical protein n=1 Tax=Streptomyces anulatus TaxID=1892 RepID=UPI003449DDF3